MQEKSCEGLCFRHECLLQLTQVGDGINVQKKPRFILLAVWEQIGWGIGTWNMA